MQKVKLKTPRRRILFIGFILGVITLSYGLAQAVPVNSGRRSLRPLIGAENWLQNEAQLSLNKIQAAISPQGAAPGVVIASPQRAGPNYYKHWVRDSALTMEVLFDSAVLSPNPAYRSKVDALLNDYSQFSRQNQVSPSAVGLGEPVFEVNGEVFHGPWGRPQNDGPAIRATALAKWALNLLDRGGQAYVHNFLYAAEIPARTVVKADLEYVAHHWQDSSFDLWEEVRGDHFFTLIMQRRALVIGAVLANKVGDQGAASFYSQQAQAILQRLNQFWDPSLNYLLATLNWQEGVNYKNSGLDVAVLLGVLYGQVDNNFSLSDVRVLKTFDRLKAVFGNIYPVNSSNRDLPPALGRYPEDKYSGRDFSGGNPWVLATLAAAEYCYKLAGSLANSKVLAQRSKAPEVVSLGDSFVNRVQFHANADGSLSEQIDRNTGYMTSAQDLTWNYAAILRTYWARQQLRVNNLMVKRGTK